MKISYRFLLDELDRAYAHGERALCEFLTTQIYEVIERSTSNDVDQKDPIFGVWTRDSLA